MRHRTTITLAVVAALLTTGCQSGTESAPAPTAPGTSTAPGASDTTPGAPGAPGATAASAPTTPSGPSVSSGPPAPTKIAMKAADGRKLKLCGDGTCEVIVKSGDSLPNAGGAGPAKVTIRGDEVTLSMSRDDGFFSTMTGGAGNTHQLNDQTILIIAVEKGRALLRLERR